MTADPHLNASSQNITTANTTKHPSKKICGYFLVREHLADVAAPSRSASSGAAASGSVANGGGGVANGGGWEAATPTPPRAARA